MNKKFIWLLLTVLILILIIFFSTERIKMTYSAPTIEQVNEYILKNSINAITVKQTTDFTIVLFVNKSSYGHYILYQDQNGKLYDSSLVAITNSKNNPVFLGGVASGDTPFVTVIINDEEMIKKAKEIEITFSDGSVVRQEITDRGIVVICNKEKNEKEYKSYIKLVIYSEDNYILYEK